MCAVHVLVHHAKIAPAMSPSIDSSRLSKLGLGGWAFGRTGWGDQEDRDSRAAILRAVERGINWIDTAAVYGDGHSERLIGETVAELGEGERPMVFTKGGVVVDQSSGRTSRELSPNSLRNQCEASLRRLCVDRVDLYQLHWPVQDARLVESAWETLAELKAEGKVRWIGASNFDLPLLQRCSSRHAPDAVQLPFSLLSRDAGKDLLPWLAELEVVGLVYSPLESGLLSGGFSEQRLQSLPSSDWRLRRPQFQPPLVTRTLDLVARMQPLAEAGGASTAQLAIAWTLAWPGVAGAIVGARSAAQVDSWIDASHLALEDATLAGIEHALLRSGAGTGPTSPPR
jgi:aryl-alcohol dehydrogenase-like predicted oxidoreductase